MQKDICSLLGLTRKVHQIRFHDKLIQLKKGSVPEKLLNIFHRNKKEINYNKGKGRSTVASNEDLLKYREIFLYAVLCKVWLTPHHKEGIYLNFLGKRLLEILETQDSGLWHPGTAGWYKTGRKNKGSPSTSKLVFDMPSFENKMMSSSSPAWSVLPDRNRLLTSHPMGSASSAQLEWRLMDIQGDEWQFSRKGLTEQLYVASLIGLQHITYHGSI